MAVLCMAVVVAPLAAQNAKQRQGFRTAVVKTFAENAQRHIRLGSWARKQGLVAQATSQFLRAKEVGRGHNPGADWLIRTMRGLGDAFWRGEHKRPSKGLLRSFDKRARNVESSNRKDCFSLAKRAVAIGLTDDAVRYYAELLRDSEKREERKNGDLAVDDGVIPGELLAAIEQLPAKEEVEATAAPLRGLDARLAVLEGIVEVGDDLVRVRVQGDEALAAELHALCLAALPLLEERIEGAPTRRLEVVVFGERAQFREFLTDLGYGHAEAHGVMDPGTFAALTFADQEPHELRAVVLHELAHLYDFGVAPCVWPSWYAEGFAESFGGIGTFRWDGELLKLGAPLAPWRLLRLQQGHAFGLRELMERNAMSVLSESAERAGDYYAQSWAFVRFMRTGAGDDVAESFRAWERQCRGAALGARPGHPRIRHAAEAQAAFDRVFGPKLAELGTAFAEWLPTVR